jgi:hypothetical protein
VRGERLDERPASAGDGVLDIEDGLADAANDTAAITAAGADAPQHGGHGDQDALAVMATAKAIRPAGTV